MSSGRQLVLDFPHRVVLGESNFFVSESNKQAVSLIDAWPEWRGSVIALYGPEGCGKTHLAHVWRNRSAAAFIKAEKLKGCEAPEILKGAKNCVIDAADLNLDEESFLHLFNYVLENRGSLLLAGREPPARWLLRLADLSSRLSAVPIVGIHPPDDELLGALLIKLFSDRQMKIGEDVLLYILPRMERTFAAAKAIVGALDEMGFVERRNVTVHLAREILQKFGM